MTMRHSQLSQHLHLRPSTEVGVAAIYGNATDQGNQLVTLGSETGNACVKPFSYLDRYDVDAWKSCDHSVCAGVPKPDY